MTIAEKNNDLFNLSSKTAQFSDKRLNSLYKRSVERKMAMQFQLILREIALNYRRKNDAFV